MEGGTVSVNVLDLGQGLELDVELERQTRVNLVLINESLIPLDVVLGEYHCLHSLFRFHGLKYLLGCQTNDVPIAHQGRYVFQVLEHSLLSRTRRYLIDPEIESDFINLIRPIIALSLLKNVLDEQTIAIEIVPHEPLM